MTRHTPLSLLAEFGPLSRDTIKRALDLPWYAVVKHVDSLARQGLVIPASPTRWDVTPAGKAHAGHLAELEAEARRKAAEPIREPSGWFISFPGRRRAC